MTRSGPGPPWQGNRGRPLKSGLEPDNRPTRVTACATDRSTLAPERHRRHIGRNVRVTIARNVADRSTETRTRLGTDQGWRTHSVTQPRLLRVPGPLRAKGERSRSITRVRAGTHERDRETSCDEQYHQDHEPPTADPGEPLTHAATLDAAIGPGCPSRVPGPLRVQGCDGVRDRRFP